MTDAKQWYAEIGGESRGPFSRLEMQSFLQKGRLTSESLVWKEGMPDWMPLEKFPELSVSQANQHAWKPAATSQPPPLQPWYFNRTTVGCLLIFFWPIGLLLMWKGQLWARRTRVVLTAVIPLCFLSSVAFFRVLGIGRMSRSRAQSIGTEAQLLRGFSLLPLDDWKQYEDGTGLPSRGYESKDMLLAVCLHGSSERVQQVTVLGEWGGGLPGNSSDMMRRVREATALVLSNVGLSMSAELQSWMQAAGSQSEIYTERKFNMGPLEISVVAEWDADGGLIEAALSKSVPPGPDSAGTADGSIAREKDSEGAADKSTAPKPDSVGTKEEAAPANEDLEREKRAILAEMDAQGASPADIHNMDVVLKRFMNGNDSGAHMVIQDHPTLWRYKADAIAFRDLCRRSPELREREDQLRQEEERKKQEAAAAADACKAAMHAGNYEEATRLYREAAHLVFYSEALALLGPEIEKKELEKKQEEDLARQEQERAREEEEQRQREEEERKRREEAEKARQEELAKLASAFAGISFEKNTTSNRVGRLKGLEILNAKAALDAQKVDTDFAERVFAQKETFVLVKLSFTLLGENEATIDTQYFNLVLEDGSSLVATEVSGERVVTVRKNQSIEMTLFYVLRPLAGVKPKSVLFKVSKSGTLDLRLPIKIPQEAR